MENTPENKAKFFALHYGQQVLKIIDNEPPYTVTGDQTRKRLLFAYLELKDITKISDYEAIEVAKIVCPEMFINAGSDPIRIDRQNEWLTVWRKRNKLSVDIDFLGYTTCQRDGVEYKRNSVGTTHAIDYLRMCGYTLPWMGLSIKQIVEYGWVKFKVEDNV